MKRPRPETAIGTDWWRELVNDMTNDLTDKVHSGKTIVLLKIIHESIKVGDKVLVFSQSIPMLDILEALIQVCAGVMGGSSTFPFPFRSPFPCSFPPLWWWCDIVLVLNLG
jgi:hypothetical protein